MRRVLLMLGVFSVLVGLPLFLETPAMGGSSQIPGDGPAYRFEELTDGVHFAIGTGAMVVMSNALVIINDDHVMLVDSSVTPAAARALVAQIKAELTDKPIRYVINSHYHFDHAHGNQIFGDEVEIIGHDYVRQMHLSNVLEQRTNRSFTEIIPSQLDSIREQIVRSDGQNRDRLEASLRISEAHWNALQETEVTPPNVTYSETMTLVKGGREIQLHFLGRGHTGGDTVVLLPVERLVFTGDFLLGHPNGPILSYMGDGFVNEWSQSLGRLKELDFDLIVPGHGEPFRDRDYISVYQRYLRELWKQVSTARNQGHSVAEAVDTVDLSQFEEHYGEGVSDVDPRAVLRIYELLQIQMPI